MSEHTSRLHSIASQVSLHSRTAIGGVALTAVLALGFSQVASANPAPRIDPLHSPQPQLIVKVNCEREHNPACSPTAASTLKVKFTSHFFVDGKDRGAANKTYKKVCSKFDLAPGYHTARVTAQDKSGNTADTGTIQQAIRCDKGDDKHDDKDK